MTQTKPSPGTLRRLRTAWLNGFFAAVDSMANITPVDPAYPIDFLVRYWRKHRADNPDADEELVALLNELERAWPQ